MESGVTPKPLERRTGGDRGLAAFCFRRAKLEQKHCRNSLCFLKTCTGKLHPSVKKRTNGDAAVCIEGLCRKAPAIKYQHPQLAWVPPCHPVNSEGERVSWRGSVCVCLLYHSQRSSPLIFWNWPILSWGQRRKMVWSWVFISWHCPQGHTGPVGWMPTTSPSFLQWKNLSARLPPGESWFSSSQAWSG